MRRTFLLPLLCCVWVSAALAAAPPTTSATTAPSTAPATLPPPPIGLGDVATQGESLAISLREMKADDTSDHAVRVIEEELPTLNHEIDARLQETSKLLTSSPSLQILPTLERDWEAYDANLADWKSILAKKSDQLKDQIAHLNDTKATWEQTLQYAEARNASPEIRQHIQSTIDSITESQQEILIVQRHIWSLAKNVDEQESRTLDVLSSVRQARQEAFNRLLLRDSPALWSLFAHWPSGEIFRDAADSFLTQLQGLSAYTVRKRIDFVFHGFIFLIFASILLWARRRVERTIEKDPTLASATPVFRAPILTAVVLSFLVSMWVYPQAPRLLWAIVGAVALVPTVLILRSLIEKRLFPILNAMVAFYFLDQLRAVVASQQVLPRLLFLIEMSAGIAFLASFITTTRSRIQQQGDILWKTMQFSARVVLAVFIVAFISNCLGYVSFANLIGDGTLGSAYLAIILYAITQIVLGLLTVALRSWPVALLAIVRKNEVLIHARIATLLRWAAFVFWIIAALEMVSLRSAAYGALHDLRDWQIPLGSLHLTLGSVVTFAVTIWASFFLSRLLRFVLEEDVYARFPVSSGISYAISKMLHYVILVVGFIFAIAALGYNMTSFTILIGAFGVGLGFGMQNIINNFVSGLILLFEQPIKVGDLIQLGDSTGVVQHIGIRATTLATTDSSEVIVPNGSILSDRVTNWTHSNRQRGIEIPVGVAAGTDPKRVIELLKSVASSNPLITNAPPPQAYLEKFSGDVFNFRLRAWTNHAEEWVQICSDLAVAINSAFKNENIVMK